MCVYIYISSLYKCYYTEFPANIVAVFYYIGIAQDQNITLIKTKYWIGSFVILLSIIV